MSKAILKSPKKTTSTFARARRYRMSKAWMIWFSTFLFVIFQFFLQLTSGEILSGVMNSFALSAFGGSLLISGYYYIYCLLQTPSGMLLDRFGPRLTLSFGALIVCVGCCLFAGSHLVAVAAIGRILMGTGSACAFVGCLNVATKWFPLRRFAMMVALVETAGMLGTTLGGFGMAHFIQSAGWRHCMLFCAVIAGLIGLLLLTFVRNSPRKKILTVPVTNQALLHGVMRIVKKKIAWLNGIYTGLMFSVVTTFSALWAVPFIQLVHHVNLIQATLCVSMLYIGVAIGTLIMGWLDTHTDYRRVLMIICSFVVAILLSIIIYDRYLSMGKTAILIFLSGISMSSYMLSFAISSDIADKNNRASSIGFTNMLCVISAPILQPLIGYVIKILDGRNNVYQSVSNNILHFQLGLSLLIIAMLISGIVAFFLPCKSYKQSVL